MRGRVQPIAVSKWNLPVGIDTCLSGNPNQNAYIERFNQTLREEVLGQHLFATR